MNYPAHLKMVQWELNSQPLAYSQIPRPLSYPEKYHFSDQVRKGKNNLCNIKTIKSIPAAVFQDSRLSFCSWSKASVTMHACTRQLIGLCMSRDSRLAPDKCVQVASLVRVPIKTHEPSVSQVAGVT